MTDPQNGFWGDEALEDFPVDKTEFPGESVADPTADPRFRVEPKQPKEEEEIDEE
ncbi:MAG: hypothetical protein K9M51_03330 [Candidatus Gracilibacteria bacterium]|nr:hypothetical protein [Candidatus Gracilibacteria bacterium]